MFKKKLNHNKFMMEKQQYAISLNDILELFNYGHLIDLKIEYLDPALKVHRILTINQIQITLLQSDKNFIEIKSLLDEKILYYNQDLIIDRKQGLLTLKSEPTFSWTVNDEQCKLLEVLIQSLVLRINNKLIKTQNASIAN